MYFYVCEETLSEVGSALRDAFPKANSGQLSDALAYGLGFDHAAGLKEAARTPIQDAVMHGTRNQMRRFNDKRFAERLAQTAGQVALNGATLSQVIFRQGGGYLAAESLIESLMIGATLFLANPPRVDGKLLPLDSLALFTFYEGGNNALLRALPRDQATRSDIDTDLTPLPHDAIRFEERALRTWAERQLSEPEYGQLGLIDAIPVSPELSSAMAGTETVLVKNISPNMVSFWTDGIDETTSALNVAGLLSGVRTDGVFTLRIWPKAICWSFRRDADPDLATWGARNWRLVMPISRENYGYFAFAGRQPQRYDWMPLQYQFALDCAMAVGWPEEAVASWVDFW